ncbi:MAG: hypothetical protein JO187_09500 [Acidobacteria bacterium]|nr:hypothetical protein [Acidobacteriota bacterium]
MTGLPSQAKLFIVTVMLVATAITVFAIGTYVPTEHKEFLVILAVAVIAARMKLTLPGFDSQMSMNLPFLLLAICELSLPQALVVSAASTFVQTLPRSGQTVKPAQAVFNICNMVNAMAIAWFAGSRAMHFGTMNKAFLTASAAAAFFVADTLPVAGIISMTSTTNVVEAWSDIAIMTFPYFVLSAGLACIVATGFQVVGWMAGGATLAIMFGVHRCFKFNFQNLDIARTLASPAIEQRGAEFVQRAYSGD